MAQTIEDGPILADAEELPLLQTLAARLDDAPEAILIGLTDEPILLPESVYRSLARVIRVLAEGDAVDIGAIGADLSPQRAADFLQIPRSALLTLLEEGDLPTSNADPLRPVRLVDLLAYRQRRSAYRRQLLGEMLRDAQELGLYDDDYLAPPDSDQE